MPQQTNHIILSSLEIKTPFRPKADAVNTGYSFSSTLLRPHVPVFPQQTVNRNTGS
jgi:hypothetical protein